MGGYAHRSHHWPTWCSWQKSWLSQYRGIHTMPYSCHREAGKITPRGPGGQWLGYSTNRLREVEKKRTFEEMDERGTPPAPPQAAPHVVHCLGKSPPVITKATMGLHWKWLPWQIYHGPWLVQNCWDGYGEFMGFIYYGPWLQDVTSGSEPLMMANWVVSCKGESRSHRGFQC